MQTSAPRFGLPLLPAHRCAPRAPRPTAVRRIATRAGEGDPAPPTPPQPSGNKLLAGGAVGLGVGLFLAARLAGGGPSFAALESQSLGLDAALSNGNPTVIEFFATWCEVCRESLPAAAAAEARYHGRVNYVMLNVENTRWAPEVLEYSVRGIPTFVFLDGAGREQAAAVGRVPADVLDADMEALARRAPLPYARVSADASPMQRPAGAMAGPSMPRDHS